MIAYGRHIGARVEMSTLGETNNAQFFSEPESCTFYRDSNSGICEPPSVRILWFTTCKQVGRQAGVSPIVSVRFHYLPSVARDDQFTLRAFPSHSSNSRRTSNACTC